MSEVVERLKEQIDELSIEDKVKLVEEILKGLLVAGRYGRR